MLLRSSRSLFFGSRVVVPVRGNISRPVQLQCFRSFRSSSTQYSSANLQQLQEKLQSLKSDAASWKEKCENIKGDKKGIESRQTRDIEEAKLYGITSFAKSLLSINDNLGLALANTDLEASDAKEQLEILIEGIKMTHVEAADIMAKQNITPFQPNIGDRFHLHDHNAVKTVEETSNENSTTITKVVKHGYKLKNEVIRTADVEVLHKVKPKPKPAPKKTETPKETNTQEEKNTQESVENVKEEVEEKGNEDSSSSSDSETEGSKDKAK